MAIVALSLLLTARMNDLLVAIHFFIGKASQVITEDDRTAAVRIGIVIKLKKTNLRRHPIPSLLTVTAL